MGTDEFPGGCVRAKVLKGGLSAEDLEQWGEAGTAERTHTQMEQWGETPA